MDPMEQSPQFQRRKQAYSRRREQFLRDAHPQALLKLKASGRLSEHLEQVGEEAAEAHETFEGQLRTNPQAPKEMAERLVYFQQIPLIAEETVLQDVVFVPPSL